MATRGAARDDAAARLRAAGDATAALDADLLLAHVCGVRKEELYAHLEAPLSEREAAAFAGAVDRRLSGEPIAYIRGFKEFFGLTFRVDRRVLVPRPETETLVEAAAGFLRATGRIRVADVGTGSGAIGVALAVTLPGVRVIATDVSADALEVARVNAGAHGVADRVDLREGDLLAPLTEAADVVTANLPYLRDDALDVLVGDRTSLAFEPRLAVTAGPDGLAVIRRCIDALPERLAAGGAAFFECDPPQADEIAALLQAKIGGATRIHADLSGAARVVEVQRP